MCKISGRCGTFSGGHYNDAIMGTIASQITSLTSVYSTVYSDADQRKHKSSATLAFLRGIHRGPVNIWTVTRKMFPFDDVIMCITSRTLASYIPAASLLENENMWKLFYKSVNEVSKQYIREKWHLVLCDLYKALKHFYYILFSVLATPLGTQSPFWRRWSSVVSRSLIGWLGITTGQGHGCMLRACMY